MPRAPKPDSLLVGALGIDGAWRLCTALGPGPLHVPMPGLSPAGRAKAVARLDARGVGAGEIARQLRCSERTVYRWLARLRAA